MGTEARVGERVLGRRVSAGAKGTMEKVHGSIFPELGFGRPTQALCLCVPAGGWAGQGLTCAASLTPMGGTKGCLPSATVPVCSYPPVGFEAGSEITSV